MCIDPKEERKLSEGKSRVIELFKLLDTWDKEESRRKSSPCVAGRSAGFVHLEDKKAN